MIKITVDSNALETHTDLSFCDSQNICIHTHALSCYYCFTCTFQFNFYLWQIPVIWKRTCDVVDDDILLNAQLSVGHNYSPLHPVEIVFIFRRFQTKFQDVK